MRLTSTLSLFLFSIFCSRAPFVFELIILFTCLLNCKHHPWRFINDIQMSIYNMKHWHVLSLSLHFVRHEGRLATHPRSPASKSGSKLPIHVFYSACLGPVPGQIDSPYLINNTQGWMLYCFAVIYFLTLSSLRNGAWRSVSPAKSRVPWLFACSQRKPTHFASFDSRLKS